MPEIENSEIVYIIEKWWYQFKRWPKSEDIAHILSTSIDDVERQFDLNLPALKRRGVDRMLKVGQTVPSHLDKVRHDVAIAVSNIYDQKRLSQKLKSLSISETQYRGWLQDPQFAQFIDKRSEELVHEELPEISRTLTRKASSGDIRAAKLLLELTGKIEARTAQINIFQDRESSTYIVKRLIEAITVHVKNPETLKAIAQDFDKIMGVGAMSLEAGSNEDLMESFRADTFGSSVNPNLSTPTSTPTDETPQASNFPSRVIEGVVIPNESVDF